MMKLFIKKTTEPILKYCSRLVMEFSLIFSSPKFKYIFSFSSCEPGCQYGLHHYTMAYFQSLLLNSISVIKKYQANRWCFWSSPQTWWLEHTLLVVWEVHTHSQMMLRQPKPTCYHPQMSEGHLNLPAIWNSNVKSQQCQLWSRACLWYFVCVDP